MADAAEEKLLTSDRFIRPTPKHSHRTSPSTSAEYSNFIPLLLLAVAIAGWFVFQTFQLTSERTQLAAIKNNQETQVAAASKVRVAIDALAASTQRLANSGNANAQIIIEELRKRGVTINPDGPKNNSGAGIGLTTASSGCGGPLCVDGNSETQDADELQTRIAPSCIWATSRRVNCVNGNSETRIDNRRGLLRVRYWRRFET